MGVSRPFISNGDEVTAEKKKKNERKHRRETHDISSATYCKRTQKHTGLIVESPVLMAARIMKLKDKKKFKR